MIHPAKIRGKVVGGARRAAAFTQREWVQNQCREKLGFKPSPGTLNMEVSGEDLLRLESAAGEAGVDLIPPDAGSCAAKALPLKVGSVPGALVLPDKEVRIHARKIVEVIAPVCLRETLALQDGDEVALFLKNQDLRERGGPDGPGVLLRGRSEGDIFPLKAVIFDLDGTLIDTIPAYFRIVEAVTERLQLPPVSRETVVEATKDGAFAWARILHCPSESRREELNAKATAIVQEMAPFLFQEEIALFAGVDRLLKTIAKGGVSMGVATSTRRKHLDLKLRALKKAGLAGLFHAIITADDVSLQKPAPDPLLACAGEMGVAPQDCLYIGDMRLDIRAGRAAGMTTVGVLTGFDDYPSLESMGPHLILESVAALQERLIF